jgi:hypothetical protein
MSRSPLDELYPLGPMRIGGVEVSPSAASELALRLYRAGEHGLSDYIGRSVDALRVDVPLSVRDYPAILRVLPDAVPRDLARLREALQGVSGQ